MRLILLRTAASAGEEPPPSEPIGQGSAETFVVARSEPLEHLVKKTDNGQKSFTNLTLGRFWARRPFLRVGLAYRIHRRLSGACPWVGRVRANPL